MKNIKYLILTAFSLIFTQVYSQQFEWQKTLEAVGNKTQQGILFNEKKLTKYSLTAGDRIIVSYMVLSKSIDVDPGPGVNLLNASRDYNDAAFSIFDVNGNVLNSQIINTPNGSEGPLKFCYDSKNKFIYALFTTQSDSIRFTTAGNWQRTNKINKYAGASFLLKYDSLGNFIEHYDFSSFNGNFLSCIDADISGNIYISGYGTDSLIYRNNYYPRNSSNIKSKNHNFLMKLNSNSQVSWVTFSSSNLFNFKISNEYNKLYLVVSVPKDSALNFKFNSNGVYNTNVQSQYTTDIFVILLNNGEIESSKFLFKSNAGIILNSFKLSKNNLLLITENNNINTAPVNMIFDTETKVSRGGSIGSSHVTCFTIPSLVYQYTNVYDSTGQINISEIYGDTSYSVIAVSNGNRLLSFKGEKIYSADYLFSQPLIFGSKTFFATYSINNYLQNLWYYNPQSIQTTPRLSDILSINKELFMVGSIDYSTNLALGNRSNTFSSNIYSTTLLKYNCKPTAYYTYKANGKKFEFKNLSLSSTTYLWEFGDGNYDTIENPTHFFANLGGNYNTKLVVKNDCGADSIIFLIIPVTSSINDVTNNVFKIYPNPTQNNFTISLNKINNYNLTIYDVQGKKIHQINISENITIDTNNWSNGVYQIHLNDNEGTYICKLIVCH